MDQQPQASTPNNPTSQPSEPQPPSSSTAPSTPTPNPNLNPNPNQNPNSKPLTLSTSSQSLPISSQSTRPPSTLTRTWQSPSHFSHFSSPSPSASSGQPSISAHPGPAQRGGLAAGVPVHHPSTSSQPAPFSSSYGQHFGGLGRGGVNLSEPGLTSSSSQVKPPMQGVQGVGMLGSIGSSSQMRPGGIPTHHQQRPPQSSLRPPSSPNNQPSASQSFQGHGLLRVPSVTSSASPLPSTSQGMPASNQPWLSSASQGKPPLPPPSYRMTSPSMQQRSHIPQQQQHPMPSALQQQQHTSSSQQQAQQSPQPQEHFGQQVQSVRTSQAVPQQQQVTRVLGAGNSKSLSLSTSQPNISHSVAQSRTVTAEADESCNRILSKRSIHELVNQIDPSERLDPEVEDILVDLADEFVESITTFGCSLAKHRKSTTLEAKDILLHLERNWNMSLPGFGGDEIKCFKKPVTNDTHKERLAVIKKSVMMSEMANSRSSAGQSTGNAKSGLAKPPLNVLGSPNLKTREVT